MLNVYHDNYQCDNNADKNKPKEYFYDWFNTPIKCCDNLVE